LAGFQPATFASSGKHTNHYTTKATTTGFASPPKEVLLQISISVENSPSSDRFEPATLGFSDKHDNHLTTENDIVDTQQTMFMI
jgi:hypothetical protein